MISLKRLRVTATLGVISAGAGWSGQLSPETDPGSIKWYAQQAKQNGETAVIIRGPQGMHEKVSSLDQALSTYHVVIAIPVDSLTQLIDSYHVYTWYKIRIIEHLIIHPNPEVPAVSIPDTLKPVKANESIICTPEGTVTVDGVIP